MLFKINVTMFQAARAIRTATAWGADITSMSFSIQCGWYCTYLGPLCGYTQMKYAMIEANSAGVLTVAAAGNNNLNLNDEFRIPCQFAWTGLCVGALANNSLQRADFSNWGWKGTIPGSGGVGIFAPGTSVRVGPNLEDANNHDSSGTSLAAPFVAGAAALARAVNPNLTDDQVRSLIMTTAVPAVHNETQPGSIDVMQVVMSAGPPHTDVLGSHSGRDTAATVTNAGLQNLTVTPGEVDYFVYNATNYQTSVRVAATYVEPIGDLFIDSIDPTAARLKLPAVRTTSVELTSLDLCAGDLYSFFVRGVNPAVGNAYNLTAVPTAATMLAYDIHESNNSIETATPIDAPHETSMDILSTDPIDCRFGLTLHTPTDVDHYRFTVHPYDLDTAFTGVSVQIHANFPLTATLFHEGIMIQSATLSTISLDVPTALPGSYRVEVRATTLNAYSMRARVYDPDGRVRAWELEDWLESQMLPDPPELLPNCLGGCPPMPPWLGQIPFDPETLLALRANGVTPITGGMTTADSELGGVPALFVLGSTTAGEFHLLASLAPAPLAVQAGAAPLLHAMLLDADGTELWRVEGLTGPLDYVGQLEARRSYLLLVAGPQGAALSIMAELPPMAGDSDSDGDTDLRDIVAFQRCFGAGGPLLPADCESCDLDKNGLIDHGDVPILVSSMTHPH